MTIPIADYLKQKNVSRETFSQLEQYVALLQKWNHSINLIGKSTLDDIWQRHILDSAQLLEHIPNEQPLVVTDFGSGAGLPGMVLALLTNHEIHLVESDKRKAAFLQQASLLVPRKVFIHNERIENLVPWKSDIVIARALAPLQTLITFAYPFCKEKSFCLFLKGVNVEEELSLCLQTWEMGVTIYPSITTEASSIVSLQHIKKKGA